MSQAYAPSTHIPMDRRQAMARGAVLPPRSLLGDGQLWPCTEDSQAVRCAPRARVRRNAVTLTNRQGDPARALYEVRVLSSEQLRINQERGDGIAIACCREVLPGPAAGIVLTFEQVITKALAE